MDTSLQSRRRRLRAFLGRPWVRKGIETSPEASGTPDDTKFCSKCRAISAKLEELLDRGFDGPYRLKSYQGAEGGRRVTDEGDLEHVVELSQRKSCSLCNFLAHMVEAYGVGQGHKGWDASEVSLFIGSAKEQYGIRHDLPQVDESFVLWIWQYRRFFQYIRDGDRCNLLLPYWHDDKYGSTGMALELGDDPAKISGRFFRPQTNFELVRSWFNDCTTHHGNICQPDASILQEIPGFTVIDCSSRRLVSWSQLPKNRDRNYVALSYVWGTEPDDGNEGRKDSSDRTADWRLPSKLPPLIEDVITAVIKLRFRYLWIDRYCIPQGDQEAKHTQIQNMDSIYGSASLTVIAAAGNDPSYGLPGVSPRYELFYKNLSASVRIGSRTFVTVGTGNTPKTLKQSKWNSRAWTMQEAFLSCRCLVFLENGAYFQCSSPRSHRFEAIHEPSALLQLRHEMAILSTEQHNSTILPANSLILTKVGKAGDLKLRWCLQLVKDYFLRSMTFEDDTLNAFSGILKYLQFLKPPIHNLWGVLMLPDVISTSSGQRIRYNLVCGLAWAYERDPSGQTPFGKLKGTTVLPRKEIFPSWTWADWRPRTGLYGGAYTTSHHLRVPYQDSSFTCLVDLSVELDDGRIVSWGQGYDSDVLWLTTLPQPPRILHIQGYIANPKLRYITEEDWVEFHERTIPPTQEAHAHGWTGHNPKNHWCDDERDGRRWIFLDADGQHLQLPLELTYRPKPWCWGLRSGWYDLSTDAYHLQRQRGNQAETSKPYTESTFDFRAILLGHNDEGHFFYMLLMRTERTEIQTETFERVNILKRTHPSVLSSDGRTEPAKVEEFLAKLTGKHAESFRGTPWVKMNTRVA